jgi:hypothetical protein
VTCNRPTPHNTYSSGALVAANAANGVAIFTGYDLRAGGIRSAKVMIVNAGSFAGRFRLFEVDASNSFAVGDLTMAIDEIEAEEPVTVYRGDIGNLPADGIDLGDFEPGEARIYRFLVVLAVDSPNGGQGRAAGGAYEWDFVPRLPSKAP